MKRTVIICFVSVLAIKLCYSNNLGFTWKYNLFFKNKQVDSVETGSILFSRIGYNLNGDKRILIRNSTSHFFNKNLHFYILNSEGKKVLKGDVSHWGQKWNDFWGEIDFSEIKKKGVYVCHITDAEKVFLSSKPFEIKQDLLWEKTWKTVALTQLEGRIKLRNENLKKIGPEFAQGGGWQDCGNYLREVNSHASMLVGLLDILEFKLNEITTTERNKIVEQIIIGADYIAFCQDKAAELNKGKGAIIHEWPKHTNVITGDVAKGALSFAKAGRLLAKINPIKSKEYLSRAELSFNWLDKNGPIHYPGGVDYGGVVQPNDGFNRFVYGAPKDFIRPEQWKTRDIVMMTWVALELTKSGRMDYKEKAISYARTLIGRQVTITNPEGRFYGHFRPFDDVDFTEKAWEHHHMGYDAGATFPHYLIPLIEMNKIWGEHKDAKLWDLAIRNFAYGYFLPACFDNPFYLLPMGYFKNEGLLTFSGLWHGINGAYGSAAALALELELFTGDIRFGKVAIGNMQWISGLNSGVLDEGKYVSKSMIYGIGDEYMGSWTKIPGTICNGFDSDEQFKFTEPKTLTDEPKVFTDEGWITHSGGWLSALSRLK